MYNKDLQGGGGGGADNQFSLCRRTEKYFVKSYSAISLTSLEKKSYVLCRNHHLLITCPACSIGTGSKLAHCGLHIQEVKKPDVKALRCYERWKEREGSLHSPSI